MPENPKILRRRIRSISNTRKITRAMEMVSAAKLRRSQTIMKAGRPYADKLQELLGRLAASAGEFSDPLFEIRDSGLELIVLFTGDRGLCAGFNNNLISKIHKYMDQQGKENVHLYCIGKKGAEYFRKRGYTIIDSKLDLRGTVDSELSREIAGDVKEKFLSGEYNRVTLAYNDFVSQVQYEPIRDQYLPLDPEALAPSDEESTSEIDYIYEPSQKDLFARLLPSYLESKLYITLAVSMTAEHSARMMSMNNATKNCRELIDSLTLKMNKARQAAITTEILEVVSGSEALNG